MPPVSLSESDTSTLRYECDETFSDECEFAARAEGEWCNHTCQENVFRTSIVRNFISRGVKPHLRTRSDIKVFILFCLLTVRVLYLYSENMCGPLGLLKFLNFVNRILKREYFKWFRKGPNDWRQSKFEWLTKNSPLAQRRNKEMRTERVINAWRPPG